MFCVDAGTDEIGIRTAAPSSMLHMTNGGVNVGANVMASFENAGAEGVSISGYHTKANNGYIAIEGITEYNGAFSVPGVFGLGINGTLTSGQVRVRGAINGRDGLAVVGTRTNVTDAGWAVLFIEDLGYTGFLVQHLMKI
ncbi:MAG: hypothetical protein ACI9N1_000428 [Flavobacteriales bacterium]